MLSGAVTRPRTSVSGAELGVGAIVLTINVPDQIVSSRIVDISKTLPSYDDTTMHITCKKATNASTSLNLVPS